MWRILHAHVAQLVVSNLQVTRRDQNPDERQEESAEPEPAEEPAAAMIEEPIYEPEPIAVF